MQTALELGMVVDYCNFLCAGLDETAFLWLQLVQNAAARLLTGTKKREHIISVSASLNWLPGHFGIDLYINIVDLFIACF